MPAGGAAELVLRGGRIVTLEEAQPKASALAAGGGRILAIGDDDEIDAYLGPDTEVIELDGRLAIPGFIEG
ncbi:MAG: amidohydrolase, partial [Thermoanaerobaculia bacterium]|nr:amidohydrolase [Thermoanaerobaculia bacterium]